MQIHLLTVFIHVTAAMAIFAAAGIEGLGLRQLRRIESTKDLANALSLLRVVPKVGGPAMLVVVLAGLYLAATTWQWHGGWIGVAIGSLVIFAVLGGTVTRPRIVRLGEAAKDAGGPDGYAGSLQLNFPGLLTSYLLRLSVLLGIVYLMTMKPGLAGSLTAIAVALVIGGLVSLIATRRGASAAGAPAGTVGSATR